MPWQPEITEVLGRLPYASNATLLARTAANEFVVYKPEQGERPLWDFPPGTLAAREALAYEISAAAGLDVVPETVLADGPYGAGSVQRFINEDETFDAGELINSGDGALWSIAVLDLIINNADRKAGHILRDATTNHLWSIDHGVSFHDEAKLRTVLWVFSGCRLPLTMVESIERLEATLPSVLAGLAASQLNPDEVEALSRRVRNLRSRPIHPHPPADRPAVPWPLY